MKSLPLLPAILAFCCAHAGANDAAKADPSAPVAGQPASPAVGNTISQASQLPPGLTPAVVDFSTCSRPIYPKEALRHDRTGIVKLKFKIAPDGSVTESQLSASSGHPDLDEAALQALTKCRFKPGMQAGQAVDSWTSVQYVWTIESANRRGRMNFGSCAMPAYPARALAEKRGGTVSLRFLVDADGSVRDHEVSRSSGSPDLDEATVAAFMKCQFHTTIKGGKPAQDWIPVHYIWSLPAAGAAPAR